MQRTQLPAWKQLQQIQLERTHHVAAPSHHLLTRATDTLRLDFQHQWIDQTILQLLFELAEQCQLREMIDSLFVGELVNHTEKRPALHTALRTQQDVLNLNGQNIIPEIAAVREEMFSMAEEIRQGAWLGFTGKPITDVVNIGIGGSHLGPQFCVNALFDYTNHNISFHFIADISPQEFTKVTAKLNPETTLFIISSKSFTTTETLKNAEKAKKWLNQSCFHKQHFIAVTAYPAKAKSLGFQHILRIWDWVGGRYSFCSAINLIGCIAIGSEAFAQMLQGAEQMDHHFKNNPWDNNLPVLLALMGIFNNNFLNIHTLLLLTYASELKYFVPYLQQLDMESNGKSTDKFGQQLSYATGPIIWGGSGGDAQHSYYQLLYQGNHRVTADFISIDEENHHIMNQTCEHHKNFFTPNTLSAGMPFNHLRLTACTPKAIGALIATYEHKIFAQGVIWHINSFDQPGVDIFKQLLVKQAPVEQEAYAEI